MGDWGDEFSNINPDDTYSCAVYAKKFDLLNTLGWKQLKDMKELQRELSELLRNPSTDKLRHQGGMGSSKTLCTCLTTSCPEW